MTNPQEKKLVRTVKLNTAATGTPQAVKMLKEKMEYIKSELPHCDFLLPVEHFEIDENICHIVMPYRSDYWKPLSQIIRSQVLTEEQMSFIVKDVMRGIMHLHANRTCHGSVCPSNIIVNLDLQQAALTDYGQQRLLFKQCVVGKNLQEEKGPVFKKIEKYVLCLNNSDSVLTDFYHLGLTLIDCAEQMCRHRSENEPDIFNYIGNDDLEPLSRVTSVLKMI